MEIDYEKLMSTKTDSTLQEYVNLYKKYDPGAVEAAIKELQKRGRTFPEHELITIRQDFEKRKVAVEKDMKSIWYANRWNQNVVKDVNAPMYYSQKAIYNFSIFFSPLFGSILTGINISQTERREGMMEVISFGIGYTALVGWLAEKFTGIFSFPRDSFCNCRSNALTIILE